MKDDLAVNKRTALKMFWDAGFDTGALLLKANEILQGLPSKAGYYLASQVSEAISLAKR